METPLAVGADEIALRKTWQAGRHEEAIAGVHSLLRADRQHSVALAPLAANWLIQLGEYQKSITILDEFTVDAQIVGSSRVDLQACKLEYSIVSPK